MASGPLRSSSGPLCGALSAGALLVSALLAVPGDASAQGATRSPVDERWLVLPSGSAPASSPAEAIVADLAYGLAAVGARLLPAEEASALFESRESVEPVPATPTDLDLVAREAQSALFFVATGRKESARRSVERVLARAEQALESVNREANGARNVLNACLVLVRALLDDGDAEEARVRALECRRLVPDVEPDPYDHPPSVLTLLSEAEARLAGGPHGTLRVESRPAPCGVFVNGRPLGRTPYVVGGLPPGEYRVQVECAGARRSRVHRVVLAAEPTRAEVDARFDAVLHSRGGLALRYATPEEEARHRLADALQVARIVGATQVVLPTADSATTVRIDWLRVDDAAVVASVRVPITGRVREDRPVLARAAEDLRQGRSMDLAGGRAPMEPWVEPGRPGRSDAGRGAGRPRPTSGGAREGAPEVAPRGRGGPAPSVEARARAGSPPPGSAPRRGGGLLLGVGAAIVGAAGVGLGWYYWQALARANTLFAGTDPSAPSYLARQQATDSAAPPVSIAGAAGGLFLAASVPLLAPRAPGVPWWAWGAGAGGVGVAAVGLFVGLREGQCIDAACTRREQVGALGGLVAAHAAPLLVLPLVYLLRGSGEEGGVSVSVGDVYGPFSVTVRGEL